MDTSSITTIAVTTVRKRLKKLVSSRKRKIDPVMIAEDEIIKKNKSPFRKCKLNNEDDNLEKEGSVKRQILF